MIKITTWKQQNFIKKIHCFYNESCTVILDQINTLKPEKAFDNYTSFCEVKDNVQTYIIK